MNAFKVLTPMAMAMTFITGGLEAAPALYAINPTPPPEQWSLPLTITPLNVVHLTVMDITLLNFPR